MKTHQISKKIKSQDIKSAKKIPFFAPLWDTIIGNTPLKCAWQTILDFPQQVGLRNSQ